MYLFPLHVPLKNT